MKREITKRKEYDPRQTSDKQNSMLTDVQPIPQQ